MSVRPASARAAAPAAFVPASPEEITPDWLNGALDGAFPGVRVTTIRQTGFIDGTENPSLIEAPDVAVLGQGRGTGSSVLLYQKWAHENTWEALSVEEQEKVIGRTKADSVELAEDVMPADSHVSRNVVEEEGEELEGDDEALMAIASLFMAGGRTTAAVQCWEQGLANDPANEEALLMLCGNAVRNRRSEEALSLCDRLIAVNPSRADYHARRAAILASLGRRAEAIEAARRGLELDPALLPLRAGLAQAYGQSGMEAEAAAERELLEALKAAGVGVGGPGSRTTSF